MLLKTLLNEKEHEQIINNYRYFIMYIFMFLIISVCLSVLASKSYALDYKGASAGNNNVAVYNFSQDGKISPKFGDNCSAYLNDNFNFARDLKQRKQVDYAGKTRKNIGFVIGFSIVLGPESVMGNNSERLRFDMANSDTMNGPISGFAAYRDCKTQHIIQGLQ